MSRMSRYSDESDFKWWPILAGIGALLVFLLLFFASTARVEAGEVGVVSNGGAIDTSQQPLSPGWHTIVPFVQGVQTFSVTQQNHQFSEVGAAAKNLQNVYVDGGVNYHVDPNKASNLAIQGGTDAVINRVLWPAFQDYIKEIVPTYDTSEILVHRADIRDAVKTRLSGKTDPFGLYVDDVFLTNIHFDKAYTDAIEQAAVSAQKVAQAKNDADALRTQAQGEADANRIKQASITPELIQYLEVQKWDGKVPVVTGAGGEIISLPTTTAAPAPSGGH